MTLFKLFLTLFLLTALLESRENPFFPTKGQKDIPYTTNKVKDISKFEHTSMTLPSSARVIKKVTIEYENLDASMGKKSITLHESIDWHLPINISQKEIQYRHKKYKKRTSYTKLASNRYIKFFGYKKTLKIITKDKIIRNFLLARPHRIVLDFKRDTKLRTYIKKNNDSVFKQIKIGNHKGYYRTVIELDGPYRYKTQKTSTGYKIILN